MQSTQQPVEIAYEKYTKEFGFPPSNSTHLLAYAKKQRISGVTYGKCRIFMSEKPKTPKIPKTSISKIPKISNTSKIPQISENKRRNSIVNVYEDINKIGRSLTMSDFDDRKEIELKINELKLSEIKTSIRLLNPYIQIIGISKYKRIKW